jgi:hypothetical protein
VGANHRAHGCQSTNGVVCVYDMIAEVDFDGRTLTRHYLDTIDLEVLLKEMQELKAMEEVEAFMLKHGENIVDMLGAEVDRIEKELKVCLVGRGGTGCVWCLFNELHNCVQN